MTSQEEFEWVLQLLYTNSQISRTFAYTLPWIGFACNLFAFISLMVRKRVEQNLLIFLFKWQYGLGIIYALNIVLLDTTFSQPLGLYNLTRFVSDISCRVISVIMKFIYCIPPWMQVV